MSFQSKSDWRKIYRKKISQNESSKTEHVLLLPHFCVSPFSSIIIDYSFLTVHLRYAYIWFFTLHSPRRLSLYESLLFPSIQIYLFTQVNTGNLHLFECGRAHILTFNLNIGASSARPFVLYYLLLEITGDLNVNQISNKTNCFIVQQQQRVCFYKYIHYLL